MTEGLLYKKIKFPYADADDEDSYLKASEVAKVLDEAKHDLSQNQGHIAGYIIIPVEKWVKWFGGNSA